MTRRKRSKLRVKPKSRATETIFGVIVCVAVGWFALQVFPTVLPEAHNEIEETISPFGEFFTIPIERGVNTSDIESAILQYTNEERREHGIAPLTWNDELAAIARQHSQNMVANDFFSHDNLEGDSPTDRARQYGYPLRKNLGDGWYSEGIGENIGKMPTGNVMGIGVVANTADAIARAQVDSWMKSPGHRQNILDSQYDRLGVGVAHDGHLYYFCTQNFW